MQTLVTPTMTPHTTSAHSVDDSRAHTHPHGSADTNIRSKLRGSHSRHLSDPVIDNNQNVIGAEDWMSANDVAALQTMSTDAANTATFPIKRLPIGTRVIRMVGEGAANAVFEIKVPRGGDFQGELA